MVDRISALHSGVYCERMIMYLFDRVKCKA